MATEAVLLQKYDFVKLSVHSSTQISSRTAAIISQFTAERAAADKPVVVHLIARAKVASKLISIVEIAKRELVVRGLTYYQYNVLSSEMTDIPREPKKRVNGSTINAPTEAQDEDSDDAFQTMGAPTGDTKKRSMPVMTIYLSRTPVKELRAQYGYVCLRSRCRSIADLSIGSSGDGTESLCMDMDKSKTMFLRSIMYSEHDDL